LIIIGSAWSPASFEPALSPYWDYR